MIQLKLLGWCQIPVPSETFHCPRICFIVGCSFGGNLAFYLGAKAKSRVHMSLQEISDMNYIASICIRTELHTLHPTCELLWITKCVYNLNQTLAEFFLCVLRVHTKNMTFFVYTGRPHWENALYIQKSSERKTFEKQCFGLFISPQQVTQTHEHRGSAAQAQQQSLKQLSANLG